LYANHYKAFSCKKHISDEIFRGLNYKTLYNWVKGSMPESSSTQAGKSKIKELGSELRALRRDLKRARQERDILKKAAAYFASQKS
jgi:transposase